MSEIEKRQLNGDGAESFERLISDYSPLEFPPISDNSPSAIGAIDLNYQAEITRQKSTPGNVPDESKVVTVYDARPINAIDFTQILGSVVGGNELITTFTVPSGVACILKWFSFSYTPRNPGIDQFGQIILGGGGITNPTFTIAVNGIAQQNYTQLNLGLFTERHPCYILAAENSIFTFTFTDPIINGRVNLSSYIILYGQFLLSTGRPVNFEPGNVGTPPIKIPESVAVTVSRENPENYPRYVAILNEAKRLKLVNASLQIPPYSAFKAAYSSSWWNRVLVPLINGIKNLTGRNL